MFTLWIRNHQFEVAACCETRIFTLADYDRQFVYDWHAMKYAYAYWTFDLK